MTGDIAALLRQARAAGLTVRMDGGALVLRGPPSAFIHAAELRARAPELLLILREEQEREETRP